MTKDAVIETIMLIKISDVNVLSVYRWSGSHEYSTGPASSLYYAVVSPD